MMMPLITLLRRPAAAKAATVRVAFAARLANNVTARSTVRPLSSGSNPLSMISSSSSIMTSNNRAVVGADVLVRSFGSSESSSESELSLCPKQIQNRLNEFQELFVEARMCIDDVKDSVGTVYYDEDADEATEAVETAVDHFEKLIKEITNLDEKNKVLRGNGLKVEQLKGELELTLKGGHDH